MLDRLGRREPALEDRLSGLVITSGSFSHVNEGTCKGLLAERPDLDLDTIDVKPIVRRQYWTLLRCCVEAVRRYGLTSLRSRGILMSRMMRTLAYDDAIAQIVRDAFDRGNYDFTLQTQSLFNAAQPGCPHFIYTDHAALARDYDVHDELAIRPSEEWIALEGKAYREATHVFTFGPNVRRVIVEKYGVSPDNVTAIGAGASVVPESDVDTSTARYAKRSILFVGVEWERKGGPELIAAFKLLREQLTDATLTIVGCSPDVEVDGCKVLGRLPIHELTALFHDASCFCMPSRVEPFGIAYAEAQQFGLPVVATDVGDVGAIIKDGQTGVLVAPGDVEALASALEQLLQQPDRCRVMGQAGMVRSQNFTWNAIARRIAYRLPGAESGATQQIEAFW